MNSDVKLGFSECFGLVTVCIITKMFYGFLPFQIQSFATSAWYINIISAVLMFTAFYFASKSFEPGKVTAFLVMIYFLLYTVMNLRETVRVIKIYNFPKTPEWIFAIAFLIVAVVVCRTDLHGGAKLAGLYSKLIIGAFLLIFIVGFNQYNFVNLAPVGGYGFSNVVLGSVSQMTIFSDVFLLLYLYKCVDETKRIINYGRLAMIVGTIITAVSAICYISVFDFSVAGDKSSGLIEVVKNAYYGHLFQRMESLFFLVMIVASAVSVCVWFSVFVYMYRNFFDIKDSSVIVVPIALVFLFLTLSDFRGLFEIVGRYGGVFIALISVFSSGFRRKI